MLIGVSAAVGAEAAEIFEDFRVEDGRTDFVDAHGPFAEIDFAAAVAAKRGNLRRRGGRSLRRLGSGGSWRIFFGRHMCVARAITAFKNMLARGATGFPSGTREGLKPSLMGSCFPRLKLSASLRAFRWAPSDSEYHAASTFLPEQRLQARDCLRAGGSVCGVGVTGSSPARMKPWPAPS